VVGWRGHKHDSGHQGNAYSKAGPFIEQLMSCHMVFITVAIYSAGPLLSGLWNI
jgi:hypothetical protein